MGLLSGSIILADVYGGSQYGSGAYSATGTTSSSSTTNNGISSSPASSSTSPSTTISPTNNQSVPITQSSGSQTAPIINSSPRPGTFSTGLWIAIILTIVALIGFFALIVHFWRRKHQKDQSDYNDYIVG